MQISVSHLPDKGTKHIPKHREPVGTILNGKVKVKDGDTGLESWRSGRSGMSADWDGDPIASNYDKAALRAFKQDDGNMPPSRNTKDTRRPRSTKSPIS